MDQYHCYSPHTAWTHDLSNISGTGNTNSYFNSYPLSVDAQYNFGLGKTLGTIHQLTKFKTH